MMALNIFTMRGLAASKWIAIRQLSACSNGFDTFVLLDMALSLALQLARAEREGEGRKGRKGLTSYCTISFDVVV